MADWSISTLKTADLSPKKRLGILYETAKSTHVDDGVDVGRYSDIANEMLKSAKKQLNENKCEDSLLNFLKYQTLVKKLRSHVGFKNLHLGKRAEFDYKLKEVAKHVKYLNENVLAAYKRVYTMSDFNMNCNLEGYQEQRPTVSTIRTFTSSRASDQPSSPRRMSPPRPRSKVFLAQRISSAVSISIIKAYPPLNLDPNCGPQRSIFPAKQMKEFNEIHRQRKTVRCHRTVVIPSRITTAFSHLSFTNNKNNVETVGYLAGKELDDTMLVITHLLLPAQQGYSDYFTVTESTPLIKFLDVNNLMTIGWIHSHPVTTPFLSSSDMHYQSIFQNVLPEAIAIVYSPTEMRSEVFNLTPDHGVTTILNCNKKGFHTHPAKEPLTMVSYHTVTDLRGELTIKDFRREVKKVEVLDLKEPDVRFSGYGHHYLLGKLLQVKNTAGMVDPMRITQSEENFLYRDTLP